MRRYVKSLKDIVDFYYPQSGKGLKMLNNKQILNRLSILLAQIDPGNNSNKLKMKRDKYYTRYTGQKH